MKSKNELISEAQELADEYNKKKLIIETALNELDSKEKITEEHMEGMSIIENMFNELDKIETQQSEIFDKIKKL